MEIAKIRVYGTFAKVLKRTDVPAGLVGGTIRVEFSDPLWDDLDKLVVFKGAVTKDVITDGGVVNIPREVLDTPNKRFQVGFYGTDASSEVVIPTFWADLGIIRPATDPSEDTSTDPDLPVWAQIAGRVDELAEDVEELKQSGGVGSGKPGEDGGYYTPSVSQPDPKSIQLAFTPSKPNMPAVEPKTITLPVPESGWNAYYGATPKMFGGVGDGVADDTDAVKQALLTGMCVIDKNYKITSRIDVPNDCTLTGNGTLVVDSATFGIVFTGERVTVENINAVIAPNLLYYAFWLRKCENVTISNVTVAGQEIMPCGNGFDVFRCEECNTVHVSDVSIRDIGMYTDYKVSSDKGNVTGINFRFCKYVEVNNFFAANLHNFDDDGNYYLDDSDALFCSGAETVFHVTNSTFIEAGKRAIKTACDNILIDNCYIYTSTEDSFTGLGFNHVSDGTGNEYPITSALVNNCTIVNHHTRGYAYCMVAAQGNVSVNNCRFSAHHDLWGCCVVDTNGASVTYSNCVFDGDLFAGNSDQTFRDCTIRNVVWPGYGEGKFTFHNTICKDVDAMSVEAHDSMFEKLHCRDDSEITDCVFCGLATFDNYAVLKHCRSKATDNTVLILNGGAYIDDFDAGEESKYIGIGFSGDGETLKFRNVDVSKNLIAKSNVSTQRIKTVPYFVEHFPPVMYSHPGMIVQSMQDMRYYRYNGVSWILIVPPTDVEGSSTLDSAKLDFFTLA